MTGPVRVLRVIARLNVGGPAHHVSLLSGRLRDGPYDTLLVAGRVGPGEASFDELARRSGARLEVVEALGPELSPVRDLRALVRLVVLVRRYRPHIVHTHTAKAGMLGRLAARIALGPRVRVVHTYHGHVLEGYFGAWTSGVYRRLERRLAQVSDRLIGVSAATVDDLVRLGVAPAEKFDVVPLGLDLDRLLRVRAEEGAGLRAELGCGAATPLVVSVGRLVAVKRIDLLLQAFAAVHGDRPDAVLAIVGDGELRAPLEAQAAALGIGGATRFLGFRHDLPAIYAAADVVALSSANEGTPVALIEAAAAGVPAVATDVGGVRDVLPEGCGRVVPAGDPAALAAALCDLVDDPDERSAIGSRAREHVRERYAADRLVRDVEALYGRLLATTS